MILGLVCMNVYGTGVHKYVWNKFGAGVYVAACGMSECMWTWYVRWEPVHEGV